jgi:LEA14-like dessication related protein
MGIRETALGLICALAFSGCALAPKFETPTLSVVSVQMQSGSIFEQRLKVQMRVQNPNTRELPVKGIEYRIEVENEELARGLTDAPFIVPAMGEAEFDVQVTANVAGALVRLLGKSKREKLEYRLVGSVALSSGFLRRIPFDERGHVNLK